MVDVVSSVSRCLKHPHPPIPQHQILWKRGAIDERTAALKIRNYEFRPGSSTHFLVTKEMLMPLSSDSKCCYLDLHQQQTDCFAIQIVDEQVYLYRPLYQHHFRRHLQCLSEISTPSKPGSPNNASFNIDEQMYKISMVQWTNLKAKLTKSFRQRNSRSETDAINF